MLIHVHFPNTGDEFHIEVNENQPLADAFNKFSISLNNFNVVFNQTLVVPNFSCKFLKIQNNDHLYLIPKQQNCPILPEPNFLQHKQRKLIQSVHKRFMASQEITMQVPSYIALEGIRLRDLHFNKIEANPKELRKVTTFFLNTRQMNKQTTDNTDFQPQFICPSGPSKDAIPIQWPVLSE